LGNWRRLRLDHALLRHRARPHVLGHRQSGAVGVTEPARGRFYTSSVLAMRGKTGEIVWHSLTREAIAERAHIRELVRQARELLLQIE
jgi:hypothetical protein